MHGDTVSLYQSLPTPLVTQALYITGCDRVTLLEKGCTVLSPYINQVIASGLWKGLTHEKRDTRLPDVWMKEFNLFKIID